VIVVEHTNPRAGSIVETVSGAAVPLEKPGFGLAPQRDRAIPAALRVQRKATFGMDKKRRALPACNAISERRLPKPERRRVGGANLSMRRAVFVSPFSATRLARFVARDRGR